MRRNRGILIAECRASSINKIRIQIQYNLQRRIACVLRNLRLGLILIAVLLRKLCIVVAGADDLIAKSKCHQLLTGIRVRTDDALRDVCKGNLLIILCHQCKRKCRSFGLCLCLRLSLRLSRKYIHRCHQHCSGQQHCYPSCSLFHLCTSITHKIILSGSP